MRIAIVCEKANWYGGGNILAASLASSLKSKGFDVACVSLKAPVKGRSHLDYFEIDKWYTPRFVIPPKALFYQLYFSLASALRRCEKQFRPDVVINTFPMGGVDVLRKTKALKVLYVALALELVLPPSRKWLYAPVIHAHHNVLKKINKVVCNSEYIKDITYKHWSPYVARNKFTVIYPCIKWDSFQQANPNRKVKQVCYVGRIIKEKGIDFVIDAFLKADVEDSKLIIAGATVSSTNPLEGYSLELKRRLATLQDPRIEIVENPGDAKIIDVYISSRCYANFNPFEHFGICPVEAMAAGTVPIVADGGGQKETVINGKTGFRIGNNTSEMAKYMKLLLTDDKTFRKMSEKAIVHSRQFDESVFSEKWVQLVEELLASQRSD
jgi:glycosyltransferase involved in cell wall biosynthesis